MASNLAQIIALTIGLAVVAWPTLPALGLPPEDEIPEELLRTRIITEARSPIDGEPMSAAEYSKLRERLQDVNEVGTVNSDLAQLIFLLQVRRVVQPILPFFP